ncbi:MAG: WbqC family protein, partial [Chitinophagaceae bacterium]
MLSTKKILIIDYQYIPCIDYFITLIKSSKVILEDFEHYQKVSFRNRAVIAHPHGRLLLSVPLLKGKNQRTIMKEVRICNLEKWQSLHWKTLTSAYRRSPWFEYYEEELHPFFERRFEFLIDWNEAILRKTLQLLG